MPSTCIAHHSDVASAVARKSRRLSSPGSPNQKISGSAIGHDLYVSGPSSQLLALLHFEPPAVCLSHGGDRNQSLEHLHSLSGRSRGSSHLSPILGSSPAMIGREIKSKYNKTDANPHCQYPHQTASGRREIRAASDQNNTKNTRPAIHLQEPRTPDRTGITHSGTEPALHDSQLTSASGSPHKPAVQVQDFQDKYQPSRAPSRPLSPTNASPPQYHASSSPPREPSFAVVDADAGKNPKTRTRKDICIPPRTRYASCDSE
jgi:hypothetical protein